MSVHKSPVLVGIAALAALLGLPLAGCSYDYLHHGDRVAYSTGNAVRANLEAETINPANPASTVTTGLGKTGVVTPPVAPAPGN